MQGSLLAGEYPSRRGEGGEAWLGKKDTGYLYKAFMVARVPLKHADPNAMEYHRTPEKRKQSGQIWFSVTSK